MDPLERRLHLLVPDRVPGLAVIVVGPESVRARVGVGFADIANGTDASPQRVCPWFSMTKILTATVAVPLAERKALEVAIEGSLPTPHLRDPDVAALKSFDLSPSHGEQALPSDVHAAEIPQFLV